VLAVSTLAADAVCRRQEEGDTAGAVVEIKRGRRELIAVGLRQEVRDDPGQAAIGRPSGAGDHIVRDGERCVRKPFGFKEASG
jgi:hypothetical protein